MTEISHDLVAYWVCTEFWAELPVTLTYRPTHPFEVTVLLGADRVVWRLDRELLRAGTEHPAGEGDVRLWPGRHTPTEQLFLHLSAPAGTALLELSRSAVLTFLRQTEQAVPIGAESGGFSLDAELQALLDEDPS